MTTRTVLAITMALALVGLIATTSYSDSHTEAKAPPEPVNTADLMAQLVGDWTTAGEFFMPGQTTGMPFPGEAKFSMVMNSYVQQDFTANLGQPFQGRGMLAYDMANKKWQNTWVDSMSTNITYYESTWDAKTKTWHGKYEANMPQMGKFNMRDTFTIDSKDQLTLTSYRTAQTDGAKEEMGMKIVYTRKAK